MRKASQEEWAKLASAAKSAISCSYSPYSHFAVSSAVLAGSGDIYTGCNIENASYGLSICAERTAVLKAVSDGERELLAVVIYTPTTTPTAPCGACRQVINEFGPGAEIRSLCDSDAVIAKSLEKLLPDPFGPENLEETAD
jgi:cytidine deaminase